MANGTLGDITRQDPIDTYFDSILQNTALPRHRWIVKPEYAPERVPGLEHMQRLLDCHILPSMWQLLADYFLLLQRGQFFVKRPNWIEPPITARNLDLRNNTAVAVGATDTTIVTYTMPDRYVGSVLGFGHALTVPTEFGTVIWNIFVNERPVETYAEFTQQVGTYVEPFMFPSPVRLKHRDVLTVTARTSGGAVSAFARLPAFIFPSRMVTQDGSYRDYLTR